MEMLPAIPTVTTVVTYGFQVYLNTSNYINVIIHSSCMFSLSGNLNMYWSRNVAAVRYSRYFNNVVFGCSGPVGGFAVSRDGGALWSLASSVPQCRGGNIPTGILTCALIKNIL